MQRWVKKQKGRKLISQKHNQLLPYVTVELNLQKAMTLKSLKYPPIINILKVFNKLGIMHTKGKKAEIKINLDTRFFLYLLTIDKLKISHTGGNFLTMFVFQTSNILLNKDEVWSDGLIEPNSLQLRQHKQWELQESKDLKYILLR